MAIKKRKKQAFRVFMQFTDNIDDSFGANKYDIDAVDDQTALRTGTIILEEAHLVPIRVLVLIPTQRREKNARNTAAGTGPKV